jgi:enediyne biosynthesis protein E4
MKKSVFLLLIAAICLGCGDKKTDTPALFEKLPSSKTGIQFINKIQDTDRLSIVDYLYFYNGGGVAAGDVNNDGLTDLFFTANQGGNKLYLNRGNWKFEDVSVQAGIQGQADWKTGVTMADVNADGLLDIYVCAVSNYRGLEGHNELYLNQGNGQFVESAAKYGLDFAGFSTQSAFFDFDHDGDLDCYLLNHAVHTSRSYDRVNTRMLRDNVAGDYFYRNDNGRFTDVSQQAGIYQATMGYGLGISVADLNNDGWEDIYVSNDFHEDDYYYINQRNGTFKESVKEHFKHLSRFSMGSDIADMNNDGYQDVMTLDMYPDDEKVEKSSVGEDPFDVYLYKLQFGYFHQYSRNCLQMNVGGQYFSDVSAMAGVAATDWSWAPLLADFDNDGQKDLFVSNGIVKRPNDLEYIKYVSNDSLRYAEDVSAKLDRQAKERMPSGNYHDFIYRGKGDLAFEDMSQAWGFGEKNISNGAIYADLDNDGDLDLVTNNINETAGIFQNKSRETNAYHFVKIKLQGAGKNTFGLGAKVIVKQDTLTQIQQLMPTRGFLSSVAPELVFGLGKNPEIDSLIVIWNNGQMEVKTQVKVDQTLTLKQSDAKLDGKSFNFCPKTTAKPLFELITEGTIPFRHQENVFYDFNRELLMPFKVSTEGPALATGDLNGDGLDDVFVGGAKFQAGGIFIQQPNGSWLPSNQTLMQTDSVFEDVDAVFFDADGDRDLDLYVVSGGNEFYDQMLEQNDRLYLNNGKGIFSKGKLPNTFANKSCVKPADFDRDGDIDLFVGGRSVPFAYGKKPQSFLLVNNGKGQFSDKTEELAPELSRLGMLTNALWSDLDGDKDLDLWVQGDWMVPQLFENEGGRLKKSSLSFEDARGDDVPMNGFWQGLGAADFDGDGDTDLVLGNLGPNTKLIKDPKPILQMWVKDIDANDKIDQILTYNRGDKFYTVAIKDELGKQLPGLINKRFPTYEKFAGLTYDDIFESKDLDKAEENTVNQFQSVYLENTGNGRFVVTPLPRWAQVSKVFAVHVEDLDQDKLPDVVLGGNLYGASTSQARYDASFGLVLKGLGKGRFRVLQPTDAGLLLDGEIRAIRPINTASGRQYLAARNNDKVLTFRKK